jgi:hypothetical protein
MTITAFDPLTSTMRISTRAEKRTFTPDGKSSDAQCCGLICLSALPASISEVQTPALPAMVVVSANQEDVAGKTPDRLYRPPIASPSL